MNRIRPLCSYFVDSQSDAGFLPKARELNLHQNEASLVTHILETCEMHRVHVSKVEVYFSEHCEQGREDSSSSWTNEAAF